MLKADILVISHGRLVYVRNGKPFATRGQYEVYIKVLKETTKDEIKSRLYVDARYIKER